MPETTRATATTRLTASAQRPWRWLESGLVTADAASERSEHIAALARRQTVRVVRPLLRIAFALVLLWVPVDLLLYGRRPEVLYAFASWRTVMVVYCVVYDLTIDRGGFFERHFALWGTALASVLSASVAASLGILGSASEPWFGALYLVPTMTVPFLVPLVQRIGATVCIAASGFLAFFAAQPVGVQNEGLGTVVGLAVFATGVAIATGHAIYALFRTNLAQAEGLARHAEALQRLGDSLADQVALRTSELSTLAAHVESKRETDRRAFAHDLHDELGQLLTGIQLGVDTVRRRAAAGREVGGELDRLHGLIDATTRSMRSITAHLRPKILDDFGVVAALEWMAADLSARTEVAISFRSDVDDLELAPELATALFRIAQEATTNALRHARASHIAIALHVVGDRVELEVLDDGVGLPPLIERRGLSLGLLGMRERAVAQGGRFEITTPASGGTRLLATMPLRGPSPASSHGMAREGA